MLKPAYLYKTELEETMKDLYLDERYKYYFNCPYNYFNITKDIEDIDYNTICRISVNSTNEITGYFVATIDRGSNLVSNLSLVKFRLGNEDNTFRIDLDDFIYDLLAVKGFEKLIFNVIKGNPAEKFYNIILPYLGGSVVGVQHKDVKLPDGKYYDRVYYEVLKDNYKGTLVSNMKGYIS